MRPALFLLLFGTAILGAQSTHRYHGDLELDYYPAATDSNGGELLIYVHGGGFSGGSRAEGRDYCNFLSQNGVACASITYTLYMRGRTQDWSCNGILSEKLKTLQLAANETWAATAYLLGPESPLPKRPERIFLAGSSAGAEAVLAAGFYDRTRLRLIDHRLDTAFRYSGIISGAGAIIGLHLIPAENPTPLLLFHGTADPLVPYGTAPHHFCSPDDSGWMMLFGAGALADYYDRIGGSYALFRHEDAGHEIAGRYFRRDYPATLNFLRNVSTNASFQQRYRISR